MSIRNAPPAAARRSARPGGVVTLMFSGGASCRRTLPPSRSSSIASSVAWASSSVDASARRSASARKACGVCAAQSFERSRVSAPPIPRLASLIVSVTGVAATTASAPGSAASCARQVVDQLRRDQRARRIVHDRDQLGLHPLERRGDRVGAGRAARHRLAARRPRRALLVPGGAATTIAPIASPSGRPRATTRAAAGRRPRRRPSGRRLRASRRSRRPRLRPSRLVLQAVARTSPKRSSSSSSR